MGMWDTIIMKGRRLKVLLITVTVLVKLMILLLMIKDQVELVV